MRRALCAVGLALLVVGGCDESAGVSPVSPSLAGDYRADHCVDAKEGELLFRDNNIGGYLAEYYVDFRNTCSYSIDVHSVACYTEDGVQAPGHYNDWLYLPSLGAERQYYTLGTDYEESVRFVIKVNYRACRAGNRSRCGRAELVCP